MKGPRPHELALFMRAIGKDFPAGLPEFREAINLWRRTEKNIADICDYVDDETEIRRAQLERVPFRAGLRALRCRPETARDYWETVRDIIAETLPTVGAGPAEEVWDDRKRHGFHAIELEMMEHEQKRRVSERARLGGVKKSKQKK